jgi:dTDP-4-dehydrorhamnose 3,5-epimerase
MNVVHERIPGIITIQLRTFADERGFFVERFNARTFRDAGLPGEFAQDNHSRSRPGVVRGLHYQTDPAQGKLVGVIRGRIWDVVVDIRPGSPTFGEQFAIELDGENGRLIWIPPGCAHGFCVLGDEPADVFYKVDQPYNKDTEGGILWNDPELAVPWPVAEPIVSARDRELQTFADYRQAPPAWPAAVMTYEASIRS